MSTVQFAITPDKKNGTTRLARGTMVGTQGPKSPLYQGATKVAVDDVAAQSLALQGKVDAYNAVRAQLKKAATALGTGIVAWDRTYGVLVTMAESVCITDDDGASLGLPVVGAKAKYSFAMPISVSLKQDLNKGLLRIHVHRAPGMKNCCVETSTDPTNPALWKELDGDGAIHLIPNPPPGTLWVRAATRGKSVKSEFTAPVSIVVK